jgi:hypothetical protein
VTRVRNAFSYYILAAVLGDADAMAALFEYFLYGSVVDTNYFIAGALKKHENHTRQRENDSD